MSKKFIPLLLLIIIFFSIGFWVGKVTESPTMKREIDNINETQSPSPQIRSFPPDFWDNHYADEIDDWNIYISNDNKIALKYPNSLTVFQKGDEDNIYLFPTERVEQKDFDLTKGFVLIIEKYGENEILLEDGSEVVDYDIGEFRFEDFFDEISGVTFFNEKTNSYIAKAEPPSIHYKYIYNVYKNEEDHELGQTIIGTIVTDKHFDLVKYRQLSIKNSPNMYSSNKTRIESLNISLSYPTSYKLEESLNEDGKTSLISFTNRNCGLRVSNNPEYVGFSTSGALCANAGFNSCLMAGKYLVPAIGDHITIVKDVRQGVIRGYRGVAYGSDTSELSASIVTPSDPNCIKDLLEILYSIEPVQ